MRAVFRRAGWTRAGSRTEFGRDWVTKGYPVEKAD